MIEQIKDIFVGAWSLIKGLVITIRYCVTPAVTVQYPTKKLLMTDRFRGLADLHVDKCIKCYQCVKVCPTACLSITHKTEDNKKILETFKYNMELCCFCGMCEQVCPTKAVVMNKIYEISVYSRKKINNIDLLNREKYAEWLNQSIK